VQILEFVILLLSCLEGKYSKQITTENIHESKTQQWRSHQWAEIKSPFANIPGLVHHKISSLLRGKAIKPGCGNFVSLILVKLQQEGFKTNETKSCNDCTSCDKLTNLMSHINEGMKRNI
jgi:hypothetical protein